MTTTMGMGATTTMSTGVATMVTAMATSTTATPLQLLLPHPQVAAPQLLQQLPLADQHMTNDMKVLLLSKHCASSAIIDT